MTYQEILSSDKANSKNVIYKFTNLINGKVYIGQTRKRLRDRLADHIWQMKNNPCYFHKALNKYGITNFDIDILEECENVIDLNGLEIYWIDFYGSTDRNKGYNLTKGGSGKNLYINRKQYSYADSKETRLKKSISAKQKWKDEEYRKRYKESRKEYVKIVKLTKDLKIIEIFPTFADAEKSICGKRNGQLWRRIKQNPGQYVEWKNYFWIKSCDLQVRKVGKSVQTSAKSNN